MKSYPITQVAAVGIIGIVLGAAGMNVLHAQTAAPPAFFVGNTQEIKDPELFKQYAAAAGKTEAAYGGHAIARGNPELVDAPRSQLPKGSIVIIQFPSMAKLKAWWNSPEYSAVRPMREKATTGQIYVIEGLPPG